MLVQLSRDQDPILFGLLRVAVMPQPTVHAFDRSVLAALHAEGLTPMKGTT